MKFRQGRFIFGITLFIALAAAFPLWRQYAQTPQKRPQISVDQIHRLDTLTPAALDSAPSDGFITIRTENGTECRPMTVKEAREMRVHERLVKLHVLADDKQSRTQQGFKITLRGTQQLENTPAAKQAFQRAAAKWEAIIQNRVETVLDVDYGTTLFGTPFPSPNVIGGTADPILSVPGYAAFRQFLVQIADGPLQTAAYNALPVGSLPTDLGPTTSFRLTSTQARAVGANPPTNASIGFNSAIPFDFDPSDGIDADKIDFEATATHEIGHALGFTSTVGIKEAVPVFPNIPSIWDFFRFRPEGLALGSITDQTRIQTNGGGLQSFFAVFDEYELSVGGTPAIGGDQRQPGHWRDEFFTGRYIGIMDPTASFGQADYITAADVAGLNLFTYTVNPDAQVYEIPSLDDNTREENITLTNAIAVNRYTPSRYPSTLQTLRLLVPPGVPAGQSLRVVAFLDPNRTGQPPANPTFIADRSLNLPTIPGNRFLDITLPNVPAITSGDLYIGIQSASVLIAADNNSAQRRASFISTDNGASFQLLQNAANAPTNFIARPILTNRYGTTPTPALALLNPSAVAPGGGEFTLIARGSGFRQNSVVRFNNADRPTTFFSGSEVRAQIPAPDIASAGTAKVTVFTPGADGGESTPLNFSITGDNPAPTIARLSPSIGAVGGPATSLNVFGTNFTSQSVIRSNGTDLATTRVSSAQLSATLPASALAAAGNVKISVFTPGPGGGTTTELNFAVVACSYALSLSSLAGSSFGGLSGVVLTTSTPCGWTATADQPWITVTNPTNGNGSGKFVINFTVGPNTAPDQRTGNLTIGGQTLALRQFGRATGVNAASFSSAIGFAPDSIAAFFGTGLAKDTVVATQQPLPTDLNGTRVFVIDAAGMSRPAPLFFASQKQINLVVPTGTMTGEARVVVQLDGTSVSDGAATIAPVAPGLFAANANGQEAAAAVLMRVRDDMQTFEPVVRFDQGQNKFVPLPIEFGPANERLFILLYGTGIRGRSSLDTVSLKFGDVTVPVTFAGAVDGLAALDQLNTEPPRTLAGKGDVTINLTVDGKAANPLTLNFK